MARRLTPAERLDTLTAALVRELPAWCRRGRAATRYRSRGLVSGELSSPRWIVRGIERAAPRPFTLDDDPAALDLRRLPPLAALDFGLAAVTGRLRLVPAVRTLESELVVVVDLSRSMLGGFFDLRRSGGAADGSARLGGLFATVACFLDLAAELGFRRRVILCWGRRLVEERPRAAEDFVPRVLSGMRELLVRRHRRAERHPGAVETFHMAAGLRAALAPRGPRVVVVVSDFLDPFATYRGTLLELLARYPVVLVDVAPTEERSFPVPDFFNFESRRIALREGARHLEEGTWPKRLVRRDVRSWNADRRTDQRRLRAATRRGGLHVRLGPRLVGGAGRPRDFALCHDLAFDALNRLR